MSSLQPSKESVRVIETVITMKTMSQRMGTVTEETARTMETVRTGGTVRVLFMYCIKLVGT